MFQRFNQDLKEINDDETVIYYDWIQTSSGQSGGPLVIQSLMDDLIKPHLIGIHTGGLKGEYNHATFIKSLSI